MINITCTSVADNLPASLYEQYLSWLPVEMQYKNRRFMQWKDRLLHLAGKLLLIQALKHYGYDSQSLCRLRYNEYGRPYLPGADIDFNIAHSGDYVLCATGQQVTLGVDIEKISQVNFADFINVMTPDQWSKINNSFNPLHSFFTCWTIKESVVKADSRGLSIPLNDIFIGNETATCDGRTWYLQQLNIDKCYCACVATDKSGQTISIEKIPWPTSIQ
jgi:4'-phosphopantetheinyl transferase